MNTPQLYGPDKIFQPKGDKHIMRNNPKNVFLFVLMLSLGIVHLSAAEVVEIPGPNLRTAIEGELGKDAGEPITVQEMATLTGLDAAEANISDLTGLEGATNLTTASPTCHRCVA